MKKKYQEIYARLTNLALDRNISQMPTGTVEFITSSIEDKPIKDFLSFCAEQSSVIKATCITPMDSFWFNKIIGPKFFTMNLEFISIKKEKLNMERIFFSENMKIGKTAKLENGN